MDWGDIPTAASAAVALVSLIVAFRASGRAKDAEQVAERSAVAAERSAVAAEESAKSASQSLVVSKETLQHQKAVQWYIETTTRNHYKKLSNVGGSTARDVRIQGEAVGCPDPSGVMVFGPMGVEEIPRGGDVTFFVNPPTDGASFNTTLEVSWREDSGPDRRVSRFPVDRISM